MVSDLRKNRNAAASRKGIFSKRGNALVLVVILFMFVSILAMAILSLSFSEIKIVHYDERHDQAYYLARSVVDATETWIASNFNNRSAMEQVVPPSAGVVKTTNGVLDGHDYTLQVWRETNSEASDTIFIEATATFKNVSSKAALSLTETISGYSIFEDAIYSYGPFSKIAGAAITLYPSSPPPGVTTGATYNNQTTARMNNAFYPSGTREINQGILYDFETIDPPNGVIFTQVLPDPTTDWTAVNVTLDENTEMENLILAGSTVLTIKNVEEDGVTPKNMHIKINGDLDINKSGGSYPTIKPSNYHGGKIFIYIYGTVTCLNPAAITIEGDSGPADGQPVSDTEGPAVYLICNGDGNEVKIIGNPYVKAYIYAPNMTVNVGGTTDLYGAVIAEHFGWNGNIGVHYVKPFSFEGTPFENMYLYDRKISIANQTWLLD
jgi:Tfp pilus assembly protein PilX